MKKNITPSLAAILVAAVTFWLMACQKENLTASAREESVIANEPSVAAEKGKPVQRSFSDLLAAQGTFNGVQYWSLTPNVIGLTAAIGTFSGEQIRTNNKPLPVFVLSDYAGFWSKVLKEATGKDVGTTVTGTVYETVLEDGTAEVTARFQTKNSIVWAAYSADIDNSLYCKSGLTLFPGKTPIYGYLLQELINNPNLQPALSDIVFTVSYIEPKLGAPFINLSDIFQCKAPKGYFFTTFDLNMSGDGVLRTASGLVSTDTQVHSNMQQVSTPVARAGSATSDFFPVEKITFGKYQ